MSERRQPVLSGKLTEVRECRYGPMIYLRHDMCVSRSMEIYGEWSEGEFDIFRQVLSAGDVVIEVGANIGTHTIGLAQLVGDRGVVMAFEPQRFVFQLLCANIALNGLLNVHTRFSAVGATYGAINVPMLNFATTNNVGGLILGGDNGEHVVLEALDGLGFQRLTLLKIDVEGMEADVLLGAVETIRRCRPVIYIENEFKDKSEQIIGLLQKFGYRMWWHLPPMYNPANFAGNAKNIFPGIVSTNMVCLPTNSKLTISGLREVSGPADRP